MNTLGNFTHRTTAEDRDHAALPKKTTGWAPDWMQCVTCGRNVYLLTDGQLRERAARENDR